jgi:hypothetical protein
MCVTEARTFSGMTRESRAAVINGELQFLITPALRVARCLPAEGGADCPIVL